MILHVYEAAKKANVGDVIVASPNEQINNLIKSNNGVCVITNPNHKTGTDRIVEVLSGRSCDWVMNIQGDEPLISSSDLERLINEAQNTKGTIKIL